jgi:broad specificity phosphatase PhoE
MLAEQLAGDGVAAIYSSDLRRAAETARIVADRLGLAVTEKPELREIDVGSWSGLTTEEVRSRFPEAFERWRAGELGHDGETREELALRVVPTVEAIARAHAGDTVLVVTHGGVIRALRRHAAGEPGESLENGATFALALVEGALVVHDG